MVRQLVFVDGIGGRAAMRKQLRRFFAAEGYEVHCFDYRAGSESIGDIEARLAQLLASIAASGDYQLIGYSFGGVLARRVLLDASFDLPLPHRLVMLASPSAASTLSSRFRHWRLYRRLTGECGQLAADAEAMQAIGRPAVPTACVYGTWPWLGVLGLLVGFGNWHDGMLTRDEVAPQDFEQAVPMRVSHAFIPAHGPALQAMRAWFEAESASARAG
ncbi:alpha/beta fold hydrolase [Pelomonas sp. SE-A7]|nr:alpha/beta fold hydrolase [Pelomonas sp. SE-A7]MDM4765064.1 alpha/beta fold hydrolase [Pelomonas sp. SE-A7]